MASISIPSNLHLVQGLTACKRSRSYQTEGLGPVTYGAPPTPLSLTCPSCEKSLPLYWQTGQKYKWFASVHLALCAMTLLRLTAGLPPKT